MLPERIASRYRDSLLALVGNLHRPLYLKGTFASQLGGYSECDRSVKPAYACREGNCQERHDCYCGGNFHSGWGSFVVGCCSGIDVLNLQEAG